MTILHIEAISRKPKQTSRGNSVSVGIKTQEYGDKWLNGWEDNINKSWAKGSVVEAVVEEKNGFLNFTATNPKPSTAAINNLNQGIKEKEDKELIRAKCLTMFLSARFGACIDPSGEDWDYIKQEALKVIDSQLGIS